MIWRISPKIVHLKQIVGLLFCLNYSTAIAQVNSVDKILTSDLSVTGQVMITSDLANLFYNMGGGGITFKRDTFHASVNFMPSLRYDFGDSRLSPALGFGPLLYFSKHWVIGTPAYYVNNKWKATLGIGYKF